MALNELHWRVKGYDDEWYIVDCSKHPTNPKYSGCLVATGFRSKKDAEQYIRVAEWLQDWAPDDGGSYGPQ